MHNYIRVLFNFIMKGKVKVIMTNHIQSILDTAIIDIDGLVETPASSHLFKVREDVGDLVSQQLYL